MTPLIISLSFLSYARLYSYIFKFVKNNPNLLIYTLSYTIFGLTIALYALFYLAKNPTQGGLFIGGAMIFISVCNIGADYFNLKENLKQK